MLASKSARAFERIDLAGTDITSQGLRTVNAAKLRWLDISYTETIDRAALEVVARFTVLEYLDLSSCHTLCGNDLSALSGLDALRTLVLDYCSGLEDSSLTELLSLANLRKLSSYDCSFSPAGLRGLTRFKSLVTLELPGFGTVTAETLNELREALPQTTITGTK